jgi:hypothetical protein
MKVRITLSMILKVAALSTGGGGLTLTAREFSLAMELGWVEPHGNLPDFTYSATPKFYRFLLKIPQKMKVFT